MHNDVQLPKVGLGVMVMKDGKVLLGKRNKNASHGDQLWCFPGGLLENGETFEEGAKREIMEEAGIEIQNFAFVVAMNTLDFLPKHYVGLGFRADWKAGEPRPEANEKMTDWTWFDLDALPTPIYPPSKLIIDAHRTGTRFVEGKK
jgi:8-oxo-dGTP diphosphatase